MRVMPAQQQLGQRGSLGKLQSQSFKGDTFDVVDGSLCIRWSGASPLVELWALSHK
jgi:hypothetical protein